MSRAALLAALAACGAPPPAAPAPIQHTVAAPVGPDCPRGDELGRVVADALGELDGPVELRCDEVTTAAGPRWVITRRAARFQSTALLGIDGELRWQSPIVIDTLHGERHRDAWHFLDLDGDGHHEVLHDTGIDTDGVRDASLHVHQIVRDELVELGSIPLERSGCVATYRLVAGAIEVEALPSPLPSCPPPGTRRYAVVHGELTAR